MVDWEEAFQEANKEQMMMSKVDNVAQEEIQK
jgi:hypothetical protein